MDSRVLNEILGICLPILLGLFVPFLFAAGKAYLKQADAAVTAKYGAEWELVKSIITQAVLYAEQKGITADIALKGAEKLNLAVQFAESVLVAKGIPIDLFPVVSMIEAAVQDEFNKNKLQSAQVATLVAK